MVMKSWKRMFTAPRCWTGATSDKNRGTAYKIFKMSIQLVLINGPRHCFIPSKQNVAFDDTNPTKKTVRNSDLPFESYENLKEGCAKNG